MGYNPASAIINCDLGVRGYFFSHLTIKVTISRCLKCGRNILKCFIGFMSFNPQRGREREVSSSSRAAKAYSLQGSLPRKRESRSTQDLLKSRIWTCIISLHFILLAKASYIASRESRAGERLGGETMQSHFIKGHIIGRDEKLWPFFKLL